MSSPEQFNRIVHFTNIEPSLIQQSVRLRFLSPDETNLICNKGSCLEIYTIQPNPATITKIESLYLSQVTGINLQLHRKLCPIINMIVLSPKNLNIDLLCLCSHNLRLTIVSYNKSQKCLDLLWSANISAFWEIISLPISTKITTDESNEFLGVLSKENNILKVIQFNYGVLSYQQDLGKVQWISEHVNQIPHKLWTFQLNFGKIEDFLFMINTEEKKTIKASSSTTNNIPGLASSPINTEKKFNSNPNSPLSKSPRLTGSNNLNHQGSISPYDENGATATPHMSNGTVLEKENNDVKEIASVDIVALLYNYDDKSLRQIKNFKLHFQTSQVKEFLPSRNSLDARLIAITSNNGYLIHFLRSVKR